MNVKTSNDKYKKILAAIIAVSLLIIGFKIYFSIAPPPKKMSFEQRIQQMIDDETGKTAIIEGQKKELANRLRKNNNKKQGAYILKTLIAAMFISIIPVLTYIGLTRKTEKTGRAENKKLKESISRFEELKSKKEYIGEEDEIVLNKTEEIDYSTKHEIPKLNIEEENEIVLVDDKNDEEGITGKNNSTESSIKKEEEDTEKDIIEEVDNKQDDLMEKESKEKIMKNKSDMVEEIEHEEDKNAKENNIKNEENLIPDIPDL